jgi:hypothetical protein
MSSPFSSVTQTTKVPAVVVSLTAQPPARRTALLVSQQTFAMALESTPGPTYTPENFLTSLSGRAVRMLRVHGMVPKLL